RPASPQLAHPPPGTPAPSGGPPLGAGRSRGLPARPAPCVTGRQGPLRAVPAEPAPPAAAVPRRPRLPGGPHRRGAHDGTGTRSDRLAAGRSDPADTTGEGPPAGTPAR